jgi:hypothetical protein
MDALLPRAKRRRKDQTFLNSKQPLCTQAGIAQDSGEGSLPDLLVEWHDQRVSAPWLLQSHMTAALADDGPAVSLERSDQRLARDDRLSRDYAGRANFRRITPVSRDPPSSRMPST